MNGWLLGGGESGGVCTKTGGAAALRASHVRCCFPLTHKMKPMPASASANMIDVAPIVSLVELLGSGSLAADPVLLPAVELPFAIAVEPAVLGVSTSPDEPPVVISVLPALPFAVPDEPELFESPDWPLFPAPDELSPDEPVLPPAGADALPSQSVTTRGLPAVLASPLTAKQRPLKRMLPSLGSMVHVCAASTPSQAWTCAGEPALGLLLVVPRHWE